MNVISMNYSEYKKYVYDNNFIRTQMYRYIDWLLKYRESGEVAFDNFIIMTKPDNNIKIVLTSTHDPDTDKYGIIAHCFFRTHEQRFNKMYPIFMSCEKIEDLLLDMYYSIVEDKNWEDMGVREVSDLDDRTAKSIQRYLPSVFSLFAKIQTDALKCKKKVIRLEKSYKNAKKIEVDENQDITSKSIVLSPGITYSIRKESAEERTFVRRCEAWMVRGHYRHYKSGKVVYIKPHQKGKGRLKQTTYEVLNN